MNTIMKQDMTDEGQGLIQPESKQSDSFTHRRSTSFDDDEFEDIPLRTQDRSTFFLAKAGPSVRTLLVAILCFALGVGVGCGLGLGVPYYSTTFTYLLNTIEGLPTLDAYGVPRDLPIVSSETLRNRTELGLRTGFVMSRVPALRTYEFNVSHGLAAPDGVWKPMILANGQSPGPLIEATVGDTVRVTVNNLMPNTSTSLHFHGINQGNSTWMDGVAGVNQCGIPGAGGSWTYEFVVGNQRGTFWWHAHTAVQFTDGLFGPIVRTMTFVSFEGLTDVKMQKVIHDLDEQVPPTDRDEILFLGENYHSFAAEVSISVSPPPPPPLFTQILTKKSSSRPATSPRLPRGVQTRPASSPSRTTSSSTDKTPLTAPSSRLRGLPPCPHTSRPTPPPAPAAKSTRPRSRPAPPSASASSTTRPTFPTGSASRATT